MTLRPTRASSLAGLGLGAGVVTFLFAAPVYRQLPVLPRSGGFSLLLLALGEFVLGSSVRARLAGRPGTRPILPLVVARFAVLARASSALAALSVGLWLGLAAFLLANRSDYPRTAGRDLATAGLNAAVAGALLVAALLLERACRVPGPPPEQPAGPGPATEDDAAAP